MKKNIFCLLMFFSFGITQSLKACSIFYYIDSLTGKIYFVNNEDYWYDMKPYIKIIPSKKNEIGRIWYGWKTFGQGGINSHGLVIDGASTPTEEIPKGFKGPKILNMTDDILSRCSTTKDAIEYLENHKIALKNAHIFFGDSTGNAAIVEWVDGIKNIVRIQNNRLIATNFNLSDTTSTQSCRRYNAINAGLDSLQNKTDVGLKEVGNVIAKAVQMPASDTDGRIGGTLYTTFIDISEMKLILIYKLDNSKRHDLDISSELKSGKRRKIKLN
jgi:choloylglycine hydrolase